MNENIATPVNARLEQLNKKEAFYRSIRTLSTFCFVIFGLGGWIYGFYAPLQKENAEIAELQKKIAAFEVVKANIPAADLPSSFDLTLQGYESRIGTIKNAEYFKTYSKVNHVISLGTIYVFLISFILTFMITMFPLTNIIREKSLLRPENPPAAS
jgi:hypothetical protein